MEKYTIRLSTDVELSTEEMQAIADAFGENFEISFDSNIIRLSDDELSVLISFAIGAIASGIFYDLLKAAIRRLLNESSGRIKRNLTIRIAKSTRDRKFFISKDSAGIFFGMQSSSRKVEYESLEEFIDGLRDG